MVGVGFVAIYLGFAYGLVCVGLLAIRRAPPRASERDTSIVVAAALGVATVVSHWLPFLHGPVGDHVETLNGWAALDPVSTGTTTLLALSLVAASVFPQAGGDLRALSVTGAALSTLGLMGGNALVQAFQPGPAEPEAGLYIATALALATAVAAVVRKQRRAGP